MTKQAWNGKQFKAIFLMFTPKFLRSFYNKLEPISIPKDAKREKISLYKLPSNRPDIVSINAICPGVIQTVMVDELISRTPQLESAFTKDIPSGRLGKPEESTDAVLWLCSPQATYMNGHSLIVDGGITIK